MRRKRVLITALLAILGVIVVFFVYSLLFLSYVGVTTDSMANTLLAGDHLVVKRSAAPVERGDIVLFKYPKEPSISYAKRVVGLPGESILIRSDKVYVNGTELPERRVFVKSASVGTGSLDEVSSGGNGTYTVFYQKREQDGAPDEDLSGARYGAMEAFKIPDGEYFVLGDNRDNSEDSRYWGTVPANLIIGKPLAIYWSAQPGGPDESGSGQVRWNRIFKKLK